MSDISSLLAKIGEYERILLNYKKEKNNYITQKEHLKDRINKINEDLEKLKEQKVETQKSIDAINLSVEEHEEKIKELEQKRTYILTGGGKNADLEIIKEKIAEESADQSALEDEMLGMWEKIEHVQEQISQASDNLGQIQTEVTAKETEYEQKIEAVNKEIESITDNLEDQLKTLGDHDSEAFNFFHRLQDKSVLPSAVPIQGTFCMGCSLDLPPDVVNKVREGLLINCPQCRRFLYYEEQEEEEAARKRD
jgi:predicted  nucleic acid-binding Zn-ribbon protein